MTEEIKGNTHCNFMKALPGAMEIDAHHFYKEPMTILRSSEDENFK